MCIIIAQVCTVLEIPTKQLEHPPKELPHQGIGTGHKEEELNLLVMTFIKELRNFSDSI